MEYRNFPYQLEDLSKEQLLKLIREYEAYVIRKAKVYGYPLSLMKFYDTWFDQEEKV